MTFDQAQSPRLGQRTPVESTYVQIMDVTPGNEVQDLPEAAWHGMLVFNNTRGVLMIWNAYADTGATWQDVAGGVAGQLTYVGTEKPVATPPATFSVGDQYYDSDDNMKAYVWNGAIWAPVATGIQTYYADGFVPDTDPWTNPDPINDPDAVVPPIWVPYGYVIDAAWVPPDPNPPTPEPGEDPAAREVRPYLPTPLVDTFTIGDIWYQTDDHYKMWRWDGQWLDATTANTDIRDAIEGNIRGLVTLAEEVDELSFLATSANNTADTADGRVSMSDYMPGTDDLTYLQKTTNTETGEVTITEVPRVDGSIWFTRTRPRRNRCKNPSLETNTAGWNAGGCTIERHDHHYVPAGDWTMHVTNSATAEDHYVEWGLFAEDQVPCTPGQVYTCSQYAELLSGTQGGLGAAMSIVWLDAAGAVHSLSIGEYQQLTLNAFDPLTLNTIAEPRLYVTGIAPEGAVSFYARIGMSSGNEGVEWHTGALLIEQEDDLGRYFDGDSYDGNWDAEAHSSTSYLEGDKIIEIWELRDSSWVRKNLTTTTISTLDAYKLVGTLDGQILGEGTVSASAVRTEYVHASEALAQGDLVHIWNDDGVFKVRKASASARYDAHGFVWNSCAVDEMIRVYHVGYNPFVQNLAPGGQWLSPVAGKVTNQPPASVGQIVQRVGYAPTATTLNFSPATVIRIT